MKQEKTMLSEATNDKIALRNNWLKLGLATVISGVVCYRLATIPFSVDLTGFSFNDLLALVLAIFSIALSVAFYFKATDTSNEFYDNTYRFTKDISEILGRIEAGFGERLKHLDEGYTGLRDRFANAPLDEGKAKEEIAKEEKLVKKFEDEKKQLIENLAKRASLEESEKNTLFQKLKEKDADLAKAREEIDFMRRRLERAELLRTAEGEDRIPGRIRQYIAREVVPALGLDVVVGAPMSIIRRQFLEIKNRFHPEFIADIERLKLTDSDGMLTDRGVRVIREASRLKEDA